MSAQASERRASSKRPWPNNQRGNSGTQRRMTKANAAGTSPMANRPRQPITAPSDALNNAASIGPKGNKPIDRPLTQPRFDAGTNSCSNGRSTAARPPTPSPTMNRIAAMNIHPFSGARAITPVASERIRIIIMNTVRRPILSPSQPKKIPPGIAAIPEANRIAPDCPNVRCQSLTKNARTNPINAKSKKSMTIENKHAAKIFH